MLVSGCWIQNTGKRCGGRSAVSARAAIKRRGTFAMLASGCLMLDSEKNDVRHPVSSMAAPALPASNSQTTLRIGARDCASLVGLRRSFASLQKSRYAAPERRRGSAPRTAAVSRAQKAGDSGPVGAAQPDSAPQGRGIFPLVQPQLMGKGQDQAGAGLSSDRPQICPLLPSQHQATTL